MSLNVPTKKDFLENYEQARDTLLLYVRQHVFPNTFEGEDDCSIFEVAFLENLFSLEPFWLQYGEIAEYPNEFRQFCWDIVKEHKTHTKDDMLDLVKWAIDPISGELIYYQDKSHEDPTGEKKTKEQLSTSEISFSATQQEGNLSILFEQQLNQLSAKQQKQLYVFYLSAVNFMAVNANNSPSDMPKVAQKSLQQRTQKKDKKYGFHLNYKTKFDILRASYPLYSDGISRWATDYDKKYYSDIRDEKGRQRLYKKLYKEVGFHKSNFNSSRFHDKLANLFIDCIKKVNTSVVDESWIEKIKKHRPPLQMELKPLPKEAYSARDIMLHALDDSLKKGCVEYESVMLCILRNELYKQEFVVPADQIKQYLLHKSQCSTCRQAEKSMREVMGYRYSRLKEIIDRPIYPKHVPAIQPTSVLTHKKLVSFYKERYRRIPCDLHKYYLALAYKQNGEIDKAREQLRQTPSNNVAISHMGAVISVYCACGKEDVYHLNALRSPKIAFGRFDETRLLDIPQINVCEPDRRIRNDGKETSAMSRNMLTFEYQVDQENWLVYPNEQQQIEGNLYYLPQSELFSLLDKQIRASEELTINYKDYFKRFIDAEPLTKIAGIGIFSEGQQFITFAGKPLHGVQHPLLGNLPFGWYIEIKAERSNKTMFESYAKRSTFVK